MLFRSQPPPPPLADYWIGENGRWDKSTRRYYLDGERHVLQPAMSLVMVNFALRKLPGTHVSPLDGVERELYEVSPQLHQDIRAAIKRLTS